MAQKIGMGWLPDPPDFRDYTDQTEEVRCILQKIGVEDITEIGDLPESVDLRPWCSPIEDQGNLGSCTAQAGIGLVEFFERRAFGRHLDGSSLFLYKVTRNLMGLSGDTGAFLRDTMKAMVLFGVPSENSWPYVIEDFDKEPSAFCYAFAQNYQAIAYYRLDPFGTSPNVLLHRAKVLLSKNLPSMFGFPVYSSMELVGKDGGIPFPSDRERRGGGHAVVAVGYNDKLEIKNPIDKAVTTGAFLIRNSWGESWGNEGYGWLPYEYVLRGQAIDWWTLLRNEWVDTDVFRS